MSLVKFKITNHPQQVAKRGANDKVDERITPQWLFDEENAKHEFSLDAAASALNTKCEEFHSIETNGLNCSWAPHRVWCNPPYSNLAAWLEKAWDEFHAGCPVIVMLLPANRCEQGWWQMYVEPFRDIGSLLTTRFISRRMNFGVPGNEGAIYHSSPPFGCVLLTWKDALRVAA